MPSSGVTIDRSISLTPDDGSYSFIKKKIQISTNNAIMRGRLQL
jgi:hypothetical protein